MASSFGTVRGLWFGLTKEQIALLDFIVLVLVTLTNFTGPGFVNGQVRILSMAPTLLVELSNLVSNPSGIRGESSASAILQMGHGAPAPPQPQACSPVQGVCA